jgi:hypothetical protein
VNACVAVLEAESVTLAVKLAVPLVAGVPVTIPVADRVRLNVARLLVPVTVQV